VVAGLLVTVVGAVLLVTALNIGESVRPAPGIGPGTLPTFLGGMLVLAGLLLAWTGLRKRRVLGFEADLMGLGRAEAVEELVSPEEPPIPWRRLLLNIGLFAGYALVFVPLGYILATALYLVVTVTLIDPSRWKRNLTFAVLFAVIVYFGFTELLSVRLPAGVLG
jgi:putative tricarboxylic transport membrane protein